MCYFKLKDVANNVKCIEIITMFKTVVAYTTQNK